MSGKRGFDAISDAIEAVVAPTKAVRKHRPMTEAVKEKLRAYNKLKRGLATAQRAREREMFTPQAQAMFDAHPYKKRGRALDLNKSGPYARSAATYNPVKNDWPGVDDIGVGGVGATRFHVPASYRKERQRLGLEPKRQLTQKQLDSLARGRAILALRRAGV